MDMTRHYTSKRFWAVFSGSLNPVQHSNLAELRLTIQLGACRSHRFERPRTGLAAGSPKGRKCEKTPVFQAFSL
jgi:hypothetical protein